MDANGRVGIGTANPTAPLHVGDGTAYQNGTTSINKGTFMDSTVGTNGTVSLQIGRSGTNNDSFFINHNNVGAGSTTNYFSIAPYGTVTPPFVITASGRVGIGNTSPLNTLHISTSGNAGGILVRGDNNTELLLSANNTATIGAGVIRQGSFRIKAADASDKAIQFWNSSTDLTVATDVAYKFLNNTATATTFSILNNGNVGIGKLPLTTLDVNGPATFANPWWIITGSGGNANYTATQVWGSSAVNATYYGSIVNTGGGASAAQWAGSTGIFTFPLAGVYSITVTMFINGTTAGRYALMNFTSSVSGSSNQYMEFDPTAFGTNYARNFKIVRYFNANDTFYCSTEGGSIQLFWASQHTQYYINKIG
jgi:hypothetical protein